MTLLIKYVPIILVSTIIIRPSACLKMVAQSQDLLVPQGGKLSLFCAADADFDFCKWTHVTSGTQCSISKDDQTSKTCQAEPRIQWDSMDTRRCGITIQMADRTDDAGEYKCTLLRLSTDEDATETVTAAVNVTVAVQSAVSFASTFAAAGTVSVRAGVISFVECQASGGFPEATLQAALGDKEGVIDEENDLLLEETQGMGRRNSNNDGTADVHKMYTLLPGMNDCGKFVKCEAVQRDDKGKLLFDRGQSVRTKKIEVTFAPQPSGERRDPLTFEVGQEMLQVDISFTSNPVPDNNQAIWLFSRTATIDREATILQAGESQGGKYEALTLNKSGGRHSVTASLIIYNLEEQDEHLTYALQVITDQGETMFPFKLQRASSSSNSNSNEPGSSLEPLAQESGISGGTIAAIIVIVVGFIMVVGLVFWAKSNQKLCFKPFDPSQTKAADGRADHIDTEAGGAVVDQEAAAESAPLKKEGSDDDWPANTSDKVD